MAEEEDFTKLGLRQRLAHKSWKARQHGYQELEGMFSRCSLMNIPGEVSIYWQDADLFSRFIVDSNVVAQESAMAALHKLLDFMSQMSEGLPETSYLRGQLIPALVEKGISSSRQGTKGKALECILMLVSFDSSIRESMELMLPFSSNKLPRLVSSLMNAMARIVESFGFVNVKNDFWPQVLEPLPRLAGHADKSVRSETMNFILEIYKWTGKPFLQDLLLEKLKPIQQKDLDKVFSKYDGTIPPSAQPRLFHWQLLQQQRQAEAAAMAALSGTDNEGDTLMGDGFVGGGSATLGGRTRVGGGGSVNGSIGSRAVEGGNDVVSALADPFDLLPTSTMMKNFPPDFEKQIKSVKWKDRVDTLQQVYDEVLKPIKKLDPSEDCSFYIRALSQILVKDANLQAATIAANSVTHLATVLREGIAPHGHIILESLLERTKEKKPSVNEAVVEALDILVKYYGVDNCLEATVEHMKHKIPQVRMEATKFFTRMLQQQWRPTANRLRDEIIMRMMPDIVPVIVKIVNDTQPSLRDSGFECFATVMKLLGEREFSDELEKLGSLKKKKIYEYFEKVEVSSKPLAMVATLPETSKSLPLAPAQTHSQTHSHTQMQTNQSHRSNTVPAVVSPANVAGRQLAHQDSLRQLKSPAASVIPTKRGATSPLKDKAVLNNGGLNTKPRLLGRSQSHSGVKPPHFPPSASLSTPQLNNNNSSNSSATHTVIPPAVLSELEDLRAHKSKWNKERQELMAKLTNFQTQTSQLNSENQTIQDQLNDVQIALNEKTMALRSKDLQITKLKNRLATLESELDAALNANNSPGTPAKSVLEGIHAISPSQGLNAHSGTVYGGSNHSDPCISIQSSQHQPQLRKASGGSFRSNAGLTSRFSPLTSSVRVATSSESSDDLPRRVHSLHIMDTTNAVAGSTTTNGSTASLLSEESWKRAAEVTNQLKARIERMRAKTRGLNMDLEDI
ncbi:Stu2p Ecym_2478 [Eremothecium cymbalariae DBVPG|uniref:Protein STU1 n=1 Tax=Eremothecium cymbalariae (strain CBS 270.75 / DBVPG 7215 / KCTC 17166 / NRRL Y-17582) TaxID=931890 RepID=G8JPU3_ERECY|nr:Hypothetical protein Ecym_2478 [Eremothecium cymbalariae DBVPG\